MSNKFLYKKIIIPASVFLGGIIIAAGILLPATANQGSQWTQETGAGISVPACTSSSNTAPTCSGGNPSVDINWAYTDNSHGVCTSASISFIPIIDSSLSGHTMIAKGDVQLSAAQVKFGNTSGLYDGTGDYLSSPDSVDWTLGSGDFTIDFWLNLNAAPAAGFGAALYAQNSGVPLFEPFALVLSPARHILVWSSTTGGSWNVFNGTDFGNASSLLTIGAWHHVAFTRSGSSWRVFIDGTQLGATQTASGTLYDSAESLSLFGRWQNAGIIGGINGYIDEYRISKGIARWTANFIPPTSAYSADGNTTLLLHQDSGGGVSPTISGLACPPETSSYTWTSGVSNTTYNYEVQIFSGGLLINTSNAGSFTTPNCTSFNYSLSNSSNITVIPGSSGSNTITASLTAGVTQPVSFTASGLPAGATVSWPSGSSCSPNCSRGLTISTLASTPTGTFPITVTGSPLGRTTTFNLIVTALTPGDFTLSLGGPVACNSVPLSWTASAGANGYRILKGAARVDITPYNPYTALNFTDTTVSENTSYLYQIEAYNGAGTNRSNALTVNTPFCPPTLSFSGAPTTVFQTGSTVLTWSTSFATSCTASGAWSGSKSTSGSQTVFPSPPPSATYTLTCTGPGGSTGPRSVVITILPLALPEFKEIIPR